jgi:uncharacterized protein (DUF1697 family)
MLYVALLRGINIGGHTVKMDRLREILRDFGLEDVRTYIQTGNVFFESDETDSTALAARIEAHLGHELGFPVPVFVRTVPELEAILAADPFGDLRGRPDVRLCVVFTDRDIPETLDLPVRSPKGDIEIIHTTRSDAYVVWYIRDGRPPAAYRFDVLGDRNTTRFYHTLAKVVDAAKKGRS